MTEYSGIAGNTLAYDVIGQGPLVVLAHGIGDSRHSFRFLAPAVAEAGYRVANVDIRGCGDSSLGWAAPTSPATWSPSCVTSVARRSSRAPATTCTPRPPIRSSRWPCPSWPRRPPALADEIGFAQLSMGQPTQIMVYPASLGQKTLTPYADSASVTGWK